MNVTVRINALHGHLGFMRDRAWRLHREYDWGYGVDINGGYVERRETSRSRAPAVDAKATMARMPVVDDAAVSETMANLAAEMGEGRSVSVMGEIKPGERWHWIDWAYEDEEHWGDGGHEGFLVIADDNQVPSKRERILSAATTEGDWVRAVVDPARANLIAAAPTMLDAIEAAFIERDGDVYYRTAGGVAQDVPERIARKVRRALKEARR